MIGLSRIAQGVVADVHRFAVVSCLLCCGCGKAEVDRDPPIPVAGEAADPSTPPPAATDAGETIEVSGFRFTPPPGWRQVELSPEQSGFVDARFEIEGYGDDVRLTMSTTGGGVEANIDRWIGQFQQPAGAAPVQETSDVNGLTVTWVDISGDFQGMGGPMQSGWRMLAAAVHGSPRDFYIKLTGPAEDLSELNAPFRSLVESIRTAD